MSPYSLRWLTAKLPRLTIMVALMTVLTVFFSVESILAAPGDLDTTFDVDGKVMTDFGSDDFAYTVATQTDGKIVVAGGGGPNNDFIMARYNNNGALDLAFGAGGIVNTDFGGNEQAMAIAIEPAGKIILAGQSGSNFAVARYNSDGSLDASFGNNGKAITNLGGAEVLLTVEIQTDGKIVAGGYSEYGNEDFVVVRYNINGSLDTSFGANGSIILDSGGQDRLSSISILPDGKILAVGNIAILNNPYEVDFVILRYNSDGSPDITFGENGMVQTDLGGRDMVYDVCISADGKIVVAGDFAEPGFQDILVARFNSDGSLDACFGYNGWLTTDFGGQDFSGGVEVQNDGKIVVGGKSLSSGYDFVIVRYNIDGSLDSTFGTDGWVTTDFGGTDFGGQRIAIQPDGKIVYAGISDVNGNFDFAVARYHANGCSTEGLYTQEEVDLLIEQAVGEAEAAKEKIIAERDETIFELNNTIDQIEAQLDEVEAELYAAQFEIENLTHLLQSVFVDPQFAIPGDSTEEQIENLVNAIGDLNYGQQKALYENLGGQIGKGKKKKF